MSGRVSALLELAAGFHPDLTGRENVFLSGALMGHSRRDMERRFDEKKRKLQAGDDWALVHYLQWLMCEPRDRTGN